MAGISPTSLLTASSSSNSSFSNTTVNVLTTDEDLLPVDNATVPWSGFDPPEATRSCSINTESYGIVAGIVAVICFLFGVLYTFFGEFDTDNDTVEQSHFLKKVTFCIESILGSLRKSFIHSASVNKSGNDNASI